MTARAAKWLIGGRVQGVGFRWFVRSRANELGLSGWATNLPDGRVEVAAKGGADGIEALDQDLRRGPRFASVENVERSDIPHEDVATNSFETR